MSSWASGGTTGGAPIRDETRRDAFKKTSRTVAKREERERNGGVVKTVKWGDVDGIGFRKVDAVYLF